jgi:hypothetical protein
MDTSTAGKVIRAGASVGTPLAIALVITLAIALAATQGAPAAARAASTSVRHDGNRSLVYVSDENRNRIAVFREDGKPVGTITRGLRYPQGLFVDARGTLYVANRGANNVLEFQRGSTAPTRVLDDAGAQPEDVTVCPNGTIYVANILDDSGGGNITVYAGTSRHASGMLTFSGGEMFFLACDPQGNLFATLVLGTTGTVVEFPNGQQAGATMLPILFGGNPAGIASDGLGNLLLVYGVGVTEFTEAGSPTGLQIPTLGFTQIALSRNGDLLLGASASGGALYTFPGGSYVRGYDTGGGPIGVALDPGPDSATRALQHSP